jgi:hypothetical protein
LFTRNRVFKHKVVVSNLHICSNGLGKIWASYIFHFPSTILTSTNTKIFNFFFAYFISQCPIINSQLSIMSKWIAKHISTKVSFKITILKSHVYIDIRRNWVWHQYIHLVYMKWWSYFNYRFAFISARYTATFTERIW